MSASTEKKNRSISYEAGTNKKMLAKQKEAEEQAKSKRRWTIGTIAVLVAVVLILLSSDILFSWTTAATVGDRKYNAGEVNYYYGEQYWNFVNSYQSYASSLGLHPEMGPVGLENVECQLGDEYPTWRDYFMDGALQRLTQIKALCDYAAENGISLTEEEKADINAETEESIREEAAMKGFPGADSYLTAYLGNGVNLKVAKKCAADETLASKVADQIRDALDYSDAELEEYYSDLNGSSDLFDYAYYYVAAETVTVEGEDGESTEECTPEALAEAKSTADAILEAYNAGEGEDYTERLNAAVAAAGMEGECSVSSDTAGIYVEGDFDEWLKGSRNAGDAEVIEGSYGYGTYVIVFLGRNDNHYNMAQVRHILIKAEADENGEYTDEAKAAAKARAEEIYEQWKSGEKTEESFAALAKEFSEDLSSSTNGGLFDSVAQGQTVEEFDKFCFEGHKPGDTAIVYGERPAYGESEGYAGYHIMYYVGEGDLYSNYIARTELADEYMNEWLGELVEGYEPALRFAAKFIG